MSEHSIQLKQEQVNEILDKVKRAKGIVLVDYRGINVLDDTTMRTTMRTQNVEYKVLKNRLVLRAFNEAGFTGMDKVLEGPTAVAFSFDDATAPARIIAETLKKNSKLPIKMKAGIIEGKIMDENGVKDVASIPSKNVLLAQLLGLLTSPMRSLAVAVNEVAKKKA